MNKRKLDQNGPFVSALGLGLMGMSDFAAVPANAVAGDRYDAEQMRMLDSER